MALQHSHNSTPFSERKFPIVVLSAGIKSPANIGALFRISDALGVSEIVFFNEGIDFSSTRLKRTARETQHKVLYRTEQSLSATIDSYKQQGFRMIGLEITKWSTEIGDFKLAPQDKIALVLGNEQHGISEKIIEKLDHCHHIQMYGTNSSMNVIQAASIGLYVIVNAMHNE